MYGYIYKTINLLNHKIYIGQHKADHFDSKYLGSGKYLKNAFSKYGKENFKCELIDDTASDATELNELEIYYIKFYDSRNPEIGYNIHIGGNVQSGSNNPMYGKHYKKSPEAIEKIRNAHLGKTLSIETRNQISEARIKGLCEGKIQVWNKGKSTGPRSKESLQKASETMKNLWHNDPDFIKSMQHSIQKRIGQKRSEEFKEAQRIRAQGNTNVKGYKWYTNGIKSIRCLPGQEPEGFYPGKGGIHSNQYLKKEIIS